MSDRFPTGAILESDLFRDTFIEIVADDGSAYAYRYLAETEIASPPPLQDLAKALSEMREGIRWSSNSNDPELIYWRIKP